MLYVRLVSFSSLIDSAIDRLSSIKIYIRKIFGHFSPGANEDVSASGLSSGVVAGWRWWDVW